MTSTIARSAGMLSSGQLDMLTATPLSVPWGDLAGVLERLPEFLKEARRIRRMSRSAAAAKIGISHSTLTKFENGKHVVSLDTSLDIMRWLAEDYRLSGEL